MKKLIKQFMPACFLFLGAFASCTSDGEPGGAAEVSGISLRLQTSIGSTRSSVDTGTEAENRIDSVRIWFFAGDASDTDVAEFCASETVSSVNGELAFNYTDEVLRLHNMKSDGKYQLFVVANLPAGATIGKETTLSDLKGYLYTATDRPYSPFCMTGNSARVHDFASNSQITIPLLRVASRLDITVKNATEKAWSINKISIEGDQQSALLFAPTTESTLTSNAFGTAQVLLSTPTTDDKVTCSGYIYENRSADAVKVVIEGDVDGTPKTWTAELKPNGVATLPRNTICGVTLSLKEGVIVLPTDVHCTIKEWDKENMNGSIHGTYLHVGDKEVHVLHPIGGAVGVTTNSSEIYVDWTNAPGFYLLGYEEATEAVVTVSDLFANLDFLLSGNSEDEVPNGKVIITAGNLSRTLTLIKESTNLLFGFKSIKVDGLEVDDRSTIRVPFWSGNINASLEITMDVNTNWAYDITIVGNDGSKINAVSPPRKVVPYSNIPGESSSGKLVLKYNDETYNTLMPLKVTIDLFLTHFDDAGVKMKTFKFTIVK